MAVGQDILDYQAGLSEADCAIAKALDALIAQVLPEAEGKVWHGSPVWFINGNPVAGYFLRKSGMQLLFWSGQSFLTPGLTATGKFKAAEAIIDAAEALPKLPVAEWLAEARAVQWDYAQLAKKRRLEKLTDF